MKKNTIIKVNNDQGDRLYIVISPEEMNVTLNTIIVCPLITTKRNIPTQALIKANVKSGLQSDCFVALDQIITINQPDVESVVGEVSESETDCITMVLQEMFAL